MHTRWTWAASASPPATSSVSTSDLRQCVSVISACVASILSKGALNRCTNWPGGLPQRTQPPALLHLHPSPPVSTAVATGARAFVPKFEGSEHCIISDNALEIQEVGCWKCTCEDFNRMQQLGVSPVAGPAIHAGAQPLHCSAGLSADSPKPTNPSSSVPPRCPRASSSLAAATSQSSLRVGPSPLIGHLAEGTTLLFCGCSCSVVFHVCCVYACVSLTERRQTSCSGIFAGLGSEVHLVFRQPLPLRGFDEEVS